MQRSPLNRLARPSLRHSALVGGIAGTAYLAEMALDMKLVANRYDDLVLWGGFVTPHRLRQRLVGAGIHYLLSAALAGIYGTIAPLLPSWPGWVRGVVFVQIENALLYPGVPVLNAVHPEVRLGRLPSLLTWRYFWVEIARHVAFGATLGTLLQERKR
jgi:hypothetical protein